MPSRSFFIRRELLNSTHGEQAEAGFAARGRLGFSGVATTIRGVVCAVPAKGLHDTADMRGTVVTKASSASETLQPTQLPLGSRASWGRLKALTSDLV